MYIEDSRETNLNMLLQIRDGSAFGRPSVLVSIYLYSYLGFYVAFNTVQVISRRVVGRAEETST